MKLGIFVSGTDTGIGKTLVSSLLVSALRTYGIRTGYFKPVQTGEESDTWMVSQLSGIPRDRFSSPVYELKKPMAPWRAACEEGIEIQMDSIFERWRQLDDRAWVVEGAGGLMVPLNARQTIRDLIQGLGLRLLLVASTRLGTINHTLLSLEAARVAKIETAGIVLVGEDDPGLESVLSEFSDVPVLVKIPRFESISPELIQKSSVAYFPAPILKALYG